MRPGAAMYTWAVNRGVVQTSPFVRLRLPRNKAAPDPLLPDDIGRAFGARRLRSRAKAEASSRELGRDLQAVRLQRSATDDVGRRPMGGSRRRVHDAVCAALRSKTDAVRRRHRAADREAPPGDTARAGAIFPDVINGEGVSELRTAVRDRIAVLAGGTGKLTPWRLRSTFATTMRNWGIGNEVIDRLQGRVSGQGVIGHYVAPLPSPGDRELMNRYADTVDAWRSA